jgi:hypothetical protein
VSFPCLQFSPIIAGYRPFTLKAVFRPHALATTVACLNLGPGAARLVRPTASQVSQTKKCVRETLRNVTSASTRQTLQVIIHLCSLVKRFFHRSVNKAIGSYWEPPPCLGTASGVWGMDDFRQQMAYLRQFWSSTFAQTVVKCCLRRYFA